MAQLKDKDFVTLDFVQDSLRQVRFQPGFQQNDREKLFGAYAVRGLFTHLLAFMKNPEVPMMPGNPGTPGSPSSGRSVGLLGLPDSNDPTPSTKTATQDGFKKMGVISAVSRSPHASTMTVALEITHMYAFHNPSHIRHHCISHPTWISDFAKLLLTETEQPSQSLIAEVVRWCLDFNATQNPQLHMMFTSNSTPPNVF